MQYRSRIVLGLATCIALLATPWASAVQLWTVHHGEAVIVLDREQLKQAGLTIRPIGEGVEATDAGTIRFDVPADELPWVAETINGRPVSITEGLLRLGGQLEITSGKRALQVDTSFELGSGSGSGKSRDLDLLGPLMDFDAPAELVRVNADHVALTESAAASLGRPELAGTIIGRLVANVHLAYSGGDPRPAPVDDTPEPRTTPCGGSVGPDVIIGDLPSVGNYSAVGGIDAFSVGTTSCNMGTANLLWQSGTNQHPVIPQHMYRLKTVDGAARMEQIGMSWMKHGFTALTQNLCCTCSGVGGSVLGVGCSDPYSASLNGTQLSTTGGLGPRYETNPHSGFFTFPYPFRNNNGSVPVTSITRRLQVAISDLEPSLNPGAAYYVEAQYVTPDDASAKNQNNNCAYRQANVGQTGGNYSGSVSTTGSTSRENPAIRHWKVVDPTVVELDIDTPEVANGGGDTTGLVILSAKATNIGGGIYHYEYALFNMNSDRAISSFNVPVHPSLTVTDMGFHDVNYHSGDGFNSTPTNQVTFDGTDWTPTFSGGQASWNMVPVTPFGNSNALRWGTTYNFRFRTNSPPTTGNITLGLYKSVTGLPDSVDAVGTVVPAVPCLPPVINAIPAASVVCGTPFTYTATSAGTGPFTWSLSGEPVGMTINPATGQIDWPVTVANGSPYSVTVHVSHDCDAATDTESLVLTVALGDFDGDGVFGLSDVGPFVDHLLGLSSSSVCAADMDIDGDVDGDDIQLFVNELL